MFPATRTKFDVLDDPDAGNVTLTLYVLLVEPHALDEETLVLVLLPIS